MVIEGWYYHFVPGFSKIAEPLYALKRKGATFIWRPTGQQAFETLRDFLISPPALGHPNLDLHFVLHTDTSETGDLPPYSNRFQCHRYIPANLTSRFIQAYHIGPWNGHLSVFKTYQRLRDVVYWPCMCRDTKTVCPTMHHMSEV